MEAAEVHQEEVLQVVQQVLDMLILTGILMRDEVVEVMVLREAHQVVHQVHQEVHPVIGNP